MCGMDKKLNKPVAGGPQVKIAAIFDLDRTITKKDTFLPFLAIALKKRPYRIFHALFLPFAAMFFSFGLRNNGWLKQVFLQAIAGGASKLQIKTWSDQLVKDLLNRGVNLEAIEQLNQHRQSGHLTILISASFDFYVRQLADSMSFDKVICTEATWTNDSRLASTGLAVNCYGPVKLQRMREYFLDDRKLWQVVAYSDHCSDLPLLEWADKAVVVNPGWSAKKMANHRNFEVRHWS